MWCGAWVCVGIRCERGRGKKEGETEGEAHKGQTDRQTDRQTEKRLFMNTQSPESQVSLQRNASLVSSVGASARPAAAVPRKRRVKLT